MIRSIFGVVAFMLSLTVIITVKTVWTCAIWMDDSFQWGGRDENGL